jgi:alpha-D-xyloside xylohydrolase
MNCIFIIFGMILLLLMTPVFLFAFNPNNPQYQKTQNEIILNLKSGKLKLQLYTDRIIRVIFASSEDLLSKESLVVMENPQNIKWKLEESEKTISIITDRLKAEINTETEAIQFYDKNGKILLQEHPDKPRTMNNAEVMGEKTFHATQRFILTPDEGIFGLGQHQDGYMNYRGKEVILVQTNTVAVNPFLISTNGYGILWDNYSKTVFNDDEDGMSFWSEVADQVDYYFIGGETMDEIIAGYRLLTGQAPLFGKWAYGYWQSKERYVDGKELVGTVEEFRKRQIPIDNIVQDWRYWGENEYWSSMKFDETIFPEPGKMIERLHDELHVHLMNSIWPAVGVKTEIYKELKDKGLVYPPVHWSTGHVYDAYSQEARDIYWKYIKDGLISKGVDALWMDATEPELADQQSHELSEKYIKQFGMTALGTIARYLNPYSLVTTEGVYQGFRRDFPNKRVFILTRSAFAGQQRNAAVTWSGDIVANWDVFRKQISAGTNFCMSGIPYWTHDIGAFFPGSRGGLYPEGCNDPAYQELYVRWFQFGAFTPIFRSHGTGTPREPWQFGEPGDWAYDILLKYDHLRYRLLPYIYSLTWKITNEDYTMMRGLPMDFSHDRNTFTIDNQYMFGGAFLVTPVTDEMYHKAKIPGEPIPSSNLISPDGQTGGLQAEYFEGTDFKKKVNVRVDSVIDFNWSGGPPARCPIDNYSVRWTGELVADETGEYEIGLLTDDGARLWLNDGLIIDAWQQQAMTYYSKTMQLTANTKYTIKLEYFQGGGDAIIKLVWKKLSQQIQEKAEKAVKAVNVYLPECKGWYDFWTGEFLKGGQTIKRETPINILPLYVKAGSLVPLGPFKQYSTEKPEDPIELRIYTGANAEFVLYEDENDNYNYEKGVYSTTSFHWNEKAQTLTIGKREGEFPGMLKERKFRILWVREGHGIGVEIASDVDEVIRYAGEKLIVKRLK